MKTKYLVTVGLVTVFALLLGGQAAYADPVSLSLRYRVADNAGNFQNNWTSIDDLDNDGVILVSDGAGDWYVDLALGQGSPAKPNLNLDLSADVSRTANGPGKLEIQLSQTNLSPSASGWFLEWSPTFVSGNRLSTTFGGYAGSGLFDTSTVLRVFDPISSNALQQDSGLVNLVTPYSLTLDLLFEANGSAIDGDSVTGDSQAQLTAVPEPNVLVLLGTGLVFCATLGSRSRVRNLFRR